MSQNKKILIISYHYPPDLAVGAIRPSKFVEYLPGFGFKPTVLTVKEKYYEQLDCDQIERVRKDNVLRTIKIPNFRDVYMCVKRYLIKNALLKPPKDLSNTKDSCAIDDAAETSIERLKRYFSSLVVWLPDDRTGWIIPAVLKGLRLIQCRKIDSIYTTGPPHSVHIIGLLLKLLTGKKWVADFRDPWIVSQKPAFVRSKLSDVIEKWFVYKVVSNSDSVVSVTPEMTAEFQKTYPEITPEKFITIYNGYDSEELQEFIGLKKYKKITFTYAGSFYYGRDPELFLRALRDIIDEKKISDDKIEVKFIGDCRYLNEKSIEKMVEQIGMTKIVRFIDPIPRLEAFAEMAKSHVLLLLAPDQPLQIPGKLYEYMGLNAYILAVCGPGATANILKQYKKAYVVPPNNKKELYESISTIFNILINSNQITNYPLAPNNESKNIYERSYLTKKLTQLL